MRQAQEFAIGEAHANNRCNSLPGGAAILSSYPKQIAVFVITASLFAVTLKAEAFPSLQSVLPGPFAATESQQVAGIQALLSVERIAVGSLSFPTVELKRFYEAHGFAPQWVKSGKLTDKSEKLLQALRDAAPLHALPLAHYPIAVIEKIQSDSELQETEKTALLDVLVSQTLMRFAFDLHNGAAAPASSLAGKPSGSALLEEFAKKEVAERLVDFAPSRPEYAALQALYVKMLQPAIEENITLPPGPSIKAGMSDARLPKLRLLLAQKGLLSEAEVLANESLVYDETTQQAVAEFQRRNGLNQDGSIGKGTLVALNTPLSARLPQIAATMERLRWLPEQMPARYVMVNLPSYSLKAIDGGEPALAMRVIIGKETNQTPLFSNVINQVVFNPTWSVPKSIAGKEFLGKIRSNPDYLSQHNYRLLRFSDGKATEVDPWNVDWDSVNQNHFPYLIRQDAGDDNALGKVKFNIPDSGAIYLHDTASPKLFAKDARALSHGCVRVERPRDLANFILGNQWDKEKINETYDSNAPRTVPVKEPVPVYLVYFTAMLGNDGTQYFYPDIYGQDAALVKKLGL